MRRLLAFVMVVAVCGACGDDALTVPTDPPPTTRPALSTTVPHPTSTATPVDPPGATTTPQPSSTVATPPAIVAVGPVVDLFYAVHVHMQNEWSPFRDPALTDLDEVAAQGYVEQVEAIAGVLETHGAVGSFHFTFGTAAGLCTHDPGYFDDLEGRGHEIGIHAHSDAFLLRAADAMRDVCGREIATGSGLAAMAGGPDASTGATLAASLGVFIEVGATQLMVNMSDHCGTASGGGNDLTPWRATDAGVCADDPEGTVLIDQVSLAYVLTGGAPADVFSEYEFSTLAGLAETAIAEATALPGGVAAWGFVTHTNEYVPGATAIARPEQSALDGLDLLLSRLDPYVASGRARWSTATEIARQVP